MFPLVAIFQLVSHHDSSWSKTPFAFKVLMGNILESQIWVLLQEDRDPTVEMLSHQEIPNLQAGMLYNIVHFVSNHTSLLILQ